jgi:hypothetical protein
VRSDDFPADPARNYAIPSTNPFVGVAGDDEIWAYGLRNPWRPSFDRATGDLWIADVGQDLCEEINVHPYFSGTGMNYGWRLREGTIQTPMLGIGGAKPPGAIDPIFDYPHPEMSCSQPGHGDAFTGFAVTGGYVYRGPITSLRRRYFFADFGTAHLWSLRYDASPPVELQRHQLHRPARSLDRSRVHARRRLDRQRVVVRRGRLRQPLRARPVRRRRVPATRARSGCTDRGRCARAGAGPRARPPCSSSICRTR